MDHKPEIVSYISKHLDLTKHGKNFWCYCPFHTEKTPSFAVSQDKQIFYCFGCGENGDVIDFVSLFFKVDFDGACKILGINQKPTTKREKRQLAREIHRQKRAAQKRLSDKARATTIDRWRWGRVAWLENKICALNEIKAIVVDFSDLEDIAEFLDMQPQWECERDCLLWGIDTEKYYESKKTKSF